MKKAITFLVSLALLAVSNTVYSQDRLIPFQARLSDGAGTPADGVYSLAFVIYDSATGGIPVGGWSEVHANVAVVGGIVNVILGSLTSLDDPDGDGDLSDTVTFSNGQSRFIGISVNGGVEMVPRHQLIPSVQSRISDVAASAINADNSDRLGGEVPDFYAQTSLLNSTIQDFQNFQNQLQLDLGNIQPVGTVIASFLSEPQFQAIKGSNWIVADGRDVLGTAFSSTTGLSNAPDLRGRYLRGLGPNPGELLGHALGDELDDNTRLPRNTAFQTGNESQPHHHGVGHQTSNLPWGIYSPSTITWGNAQTGTGPASRSSNQSDSHTHNVVSGGDNETRPYSVVVNYFIRIN